MAKEQGFLTYSWQYYKTDPNDINLAVEAIRKGKLSIRKASKQYKIPFETLRTHANGQRQITLGRPPALSKENEEALKDAITEILRMGHGIGLNDLRELGRDIAGLGENECFKKETPSRGWARRFVSRHGLAMPVSENVSAAQMDIENHEIFN